MDTSLSAGAAPGAAPPPACPPVLVVIVNYRTGPLVVECLRSLQAEIAAAPGSRVTVVDNRSPDHSADVIAAAIEREGWSSWVTLARSPVNGGFSYGNNHAVRPALESADPPAYFWLLNPDCVVRPGALRALVDHFEAHPQVGIAGSSLEQADGSVWAHAFRFPSLWSELASGLRLSLAARLLKKHTVLLDMDVSRPAQVDWLPGASMMVRREVFQQVGLMDEDYFLYFEETDFCLAARRAGWLCWYVPASRVMHISGQSTGVTGRQATQNRRPKYWFDSRRRYFVKNHGWAYAAATDVIYALSYATLRLRSALQRKPVDQPPHYFADFLRNSALFHRGTPANPALQGDAGSRR